MRVVPQERHRPVIATSTQRLRIGRACEILAGSAESITGIARRMGFSDSQHFARVFRKYMGETPPESRDRVLVERHP